MVAGLVVTVAAATRIAARGNLSTFDRAAGTAAAGIFLLTFAGLFVAAAAGLGLLAILWFFVALAGAGAAIDAWLERVLVFMCLMQIGIGASLAATWLLWRRRHGHAGLRA
ncbi:MAG TPA: hypothetical protein VKX28_24930 [Xanthobacteraceae bacterium]|nr:hypothetical protein [Xanthobacteraceae bacterium]